jgi:uncharacterized protein
MADITPPVPAGRQLIRRYGDGGFEIAGVRHDGSVLVMAEQTLAWPPSSAGDIDFDSLAPCVSPEADVTVLLIGTGVRLVPVPAELRVRLRAHGIGVEAMDTGAACRTFNVLLSEERAVAAALIAV